MSRIRVLQVVTGLLPGGAERLVLDMMSRFNAELFDVRLVSIVGDLTALEVYGFQNQEVHVFDMRSGSRIKSLVGLRDFIKFFSPDIIHAHMFHSLVATLITSRLLPNPPKIGFTSHLSHYSKVRAFLVTILRPFRHFDIIFSEGQHSEMNAAYTRVIANGVHVCSSPPVRAAWGCGRPVRLLSVGRLADQKDPVGLIRTLANGELPPWSLSFVGSGPIEGSLRQAISSFGLDDRVQLLGVRDDVRHHMRSADIFVMHSKYEGMPMALLEAGAEGMPVVATPVGSIPEVIGNNRGYLADTKAFSDTVRKLIENPCVALSAGQALWRHINMYYNIDNTVRTHEQCYRSACLFGVNDE